MSAVSSARNFSAAATADISGGYRRRTAIPPQSADVMRNECEGLAMSPLRPQAYIWAAAANLPEMSMQLLGWQNDPTFENDTYVVLPSPSEVAFANCEKVVERDVEIYRKKSQSI